MNVFSNLRRMWAGRGGHSRVSDRSGDGGPYTFPVGEGVRGDVQPYDEPLRMHDVLHQDGNAIVLQPTGVESPLEELTGAEDLTDQRLWFNLMWSSLAMDFEPQHAAFYVEAYKATADAGTVYWNTYSREADRRPSMEGWRTFDMTTTDLEVARANRTR